MQPSLARGRLRHGATAPGCRTATGCPRAAPKAVVLALHGFNDSRDAWEIPAPDFAAAGIALYAPDQRGFGEAPGRGLWAGADAMADDAAEMARLLRRRYSGAKLYLMGESMGGAVLMRLASRAEAPPGRRLRARGARGMGAGADERVSAFQPVAGRDPGARPVG